MSQAKLAINVLGRTMSYRNSVQKSPQTNGVQSECWCWEDCKLGTRGGRTTLVTGQKALNLTPQNESRSLAASHTSRRPENWLSFKHQLKIVQHNRDGEHVRQDCHRDDWAPPGATAQNWICSLWSGGGVRSFKQQALCNATAYRSGAFSSPAGFEIKSGSRSLEAT